MKNSLLIAGLVLLISCKNTSEKEIENTSAETTTETNIAAQDTLIYPEEVHFKSIRQVTFGGDNAEAYWSFDDSKLVFQSNYEEWGVACDQMFLMDAGASFKDKKPPMVSTGKGRTTCAYFMPDNKHIVYASTHLVDENCPEAPLRKNGKS